MINMVDQAVWERDAMVLSDKKIFLWYLENGEGRESDEMSIIFMSMAWGVK